MKRPSFYDSKEWKRLRAKMLGRPGACCSKCGAKRKQRRLIVDHMTPIKVDWSRRLDRANLRILCSTCDNARHAVERARYVLPRGTKHDGMPTHPDHPWVNGGIVLEGEARLRKPMGEGQKSLANQSAAPFSPSPSPRHRRHTKADWGLE